MQKHDRGLGKPARCGRSLESRLTPGTGKTTTLVQLSGALLQAGHVVAVVVPLGEWSDRREDFSTFLTRRNAFGPLLRVSKGRNVSLRRGSWLWN
jgi:hypothetical protein